MYLHNIGIRDTVFHIIFRMKRCFQLLGRFQFLEIGINYEQLDLLTILKIVCDIKGK